MVRYLVTVRVTPERYAEFSSMGFDAAAAMGSQSWERFGGRTLCYYFGNAASQWHVMAVGEVPNREAAFALASAVYQLGGVVEASLLELFTGAEADAALVKP